MKKNDKERLKQLDSNVIPKPSCLKWSVVGTGQMKITLDSRKDSQRQVISLYSGTMVGEMGQWTG